MLLWKKSFHNCTTQIQRIHIKKKDFSLFSENCTNAKMCTDTRWKVTTQHFSNSMKRKTLGFFFSSFRLKEYNSIKVMLKIHKVIKLWFYVEVLLVAHKHNFL